MTSHDYDYREAAYRAYQFADRLLTILYSARLARGLNCTQLAERMNIPEQLIDDIEHGRQPLTMPIITDWMCETGVTISIFGALAGRELPPRRNEHYMDTQLETAYCNDNE